MPSTDSEDYYNGLEVFQKHDESDAKTFSEHEFFSTNCGKKMKHFHCDSITDCEPNVEHDYPRIDTSHLPNNQNLIMFEDRLETFKNWTSIIEAVLLAQSGFYYTQVGDEVSCFACNTTLGDWKPEDVPDVEHENLSKDCLFIRGRFRPNKEEPEEFWINNRPEHLNMRNKNQRYKTFEEWPKNLAQSKMDMVDAGFFYTKKSDKSVCFFCNIHIHRWERDDIPIVEHAFWNPKCPYVHAVMGKEFVDVVQKNGREEGMKYLKDMKNDQDNASLIMEQNCKICSEKAEMLCDPCGHIVICQDCSQNMRTCPECGTMVETMIKTYM